MKPDYYTSTGKKVKDFLLGVAAALPALVPILGQIAWIFGVFYFFRKGRRFIAIGMLSSLALALLAFGACYLVVANMKF